MHRAAAIHLAPPVTLQPQHSLLVRDIEHEVVSAALVASIGLLPWSPLGGGWLIGKYQRDVAPTGASRLGENPERGMEAWEARNRDEATWLVLDAVQTIAHERDRTASQGVIAWLLAQPAATSVILDARFVAQLVDNLGASDVDLTAEEVARLSSVSAPRNDDYPYGSGGVAQRRRKIEGGR